MLKVTFPKEKMIMGFLSQFLVLSDHSAVPKLEQFETHSHTLENFLSCNFLNFLDNCSTEAGHLEE